jgi:hypothetical protein
MENFELLLTVTDNKKEYKYYGNQGESDENANTKLYYKDELLSDNYFANNDLMETLSRIYNEELTEYTMSDNMKYNYQCMIENGYFNE